MPTVETVTNSALNNIIEALAAGGHPLTDEQIRIISKLREKWATIFREDARHHD